MVPTHPPFPQNTTGILGWKALGSFPVFPGSPSSPDSEHWQPLPHAAMTLEFEISLSHYPKGRCTGFWEVAELLIPVLIPVYGLLQILGKKDGLT